MRAMPATALLAVTAATATALVVTRPVVVHIPHVVADFGARADLPETTLVMANPVDGCSPFLNDVADKVVLVRRGSCRFVTKARMAHRANASGLIVMDDMHRRESSSSTTDDIQDDGRWEVRMYSEDTVRETGKSQQEPHLPPSVFVSHASGRCLERLVHDTALPSTNGQKGVQIVLNSTGEVHQPEEEQDVDILDLRLSTFVDLIYAMLPYMGYAYASSFCFVVLSTFYARAVETSAWYTKQYGASPSFCRVLLHEAVANSWPVVRRSIWRRLAVVPYEGSLHHGDTCSICLDDFVLGHIVKVLPCPHVYHQDCIDRWFEKGSNSCPMCKREAFS